MGFQEPCSGKIAEIAPAATNLILDNYNCYYMLQKIQTNTSSKESHRPCP